jgi:hypothetical protein
MINEKYDYRFEEISSNLRSKSLELYASLCDL